MVRSVWREVLLGTTALVNRLSDRCANGYARSIGELGPTPKLGAGIRTGNYACFMGCANANNAGPLSLRPSKRGRLRVPNASYTGFGLPQSMVLISCRPRTYLRTK